jgi:hypothetical protein
VVVSWRGGGNDGDVVSIDGFFLLYSKLFPKYRI